MKVFFCLVPLLAIPAAASPSAEWSLTRAFVTGLKHDILCVETEIIIHADEDDLTVRGWRGDDGPDAVMIDMRAFTSDGRALGDVITTGPAESFRKTVVIPKGASRRFVVFTGTFFVTKSGSYVAKGKLQGVSIAGRSLNLPLKELPFHVDLSEQKKPNKAPEPTPRPVTIPAEPGIAPARSVAHL